MSTTAAAPAKPGIAEIFRELAREWKERSRRLSNTAQMALLDSYQKIIGLGPPAVPLILEELRAEPDQWFWALRAITRENPVPREAAADVTRSAKAWVEWGVRNGLIAP